MLKDQIKMHIKLELTSVSMKSSGFEETASDLPLREDTNVEGLHPVNRNKNQ